MAETLVLTEEEALEVLAFLVSAARTQLTEAAEYAPLRMLTAAGRLAELMGPRASPETRAFLAGPLGEIRDAVLRSGDPTAYADQLDRACAALARHLVAHFGLDRSAP